jgi:catechol 2,3-dioxygenase
MVNSAKEPETRPLLPKATHLGLVKLWVTDLDRQVAFYTQVIGLKVISQDSLQASLGAGRKELLRLSVKPKSRAYHDRAGLYHFCLLIPERRQFALLLKRLAKAEVPLQGLVDHRMAEAIYLPDPEGNGIELNWDKPRAEWEGRLEELISLGNLPLDVDGLMELADAPGADDGLLPQDASLGHVHLHVADLAASRRFYHELLGLDITGEYPRQAVFTSAGGYHHHIAFNIWHGKGAPEPPLDASGLDWFSLELPSLRARDIVAERLKAAGLNLQELPEGLLARDPAGNGVLLSAA